MRPWEKSI